MQPQGMDPGRAFGNYLRSERELRQIPLSEVAVVTKIPLRTLESLEAGRWQDLPPEVFVRGFVRSYVRHVGLSEDEALRRFAVLTQPPAPEAPEEDPVEEQGAEPTAIRWPSPMSSRRRFEVALFVIIVLILTTITLSLLWRRGGANTDIQACASPASWQAPAGSSARPC